LAALQTNRFSNAEYKRTTHHVEAPVGDTLADMLNPSYWSHVARLLKPMDIIEAVADDNTFEASFRVIACSVNWAKVAMRSYTSYQDSQEFSVPANVAVDYLIEHAGNHDKWRIVRKSDKAVIASKMATKDEADAALKQHVLTINHTTPKKTAAA
jgi:hypothetical protein